MGVIFDCSVFINVGLGWIAEMDDATAFRLFLLSFFDTDFTFGRSLIAVVGDTSDGAIGEEVTVVMLVFGNKYGVIFDELVVAVVGVTVAKKKKKMRNKVTAKTEIQIENNNCIYHSLMLNSNPKHSSLV